MEDSNYFIQQLYRIFNAEGFAINANEVASFIKREDPDNWTEKSVRLIELVYVTSNDDWKGIQCFKFLDQKSKDNSRVQSLRRYLQIEYGINLFMSAESVNVNGRVYTFTVNGTLTKRGYDEKSEDEYEDEPDPFVDDDYPVHTVRKRYKKHTYSNTRSTNPIYDYDEKDQKALDECLIQGLVEIQFCRRELMKKSIGVKCLCLAAAYLCKQSSSPVEMNDVMRSVFLVLKTAHKNEKLKASYLAWFQFNIGLPTVQAELQQSNDNDSKAFLSFFFDNVSSLYCESKGALVGNLRTLIQQGKMKYLKKIFDKLSLDDILFLCDTVLSNKEGLTERKKVFLTQHQSQANSLLEVIYTNWNTQEKGVGNMIKQYTKKSS